MTTLSGMTASGRACLAAMSADPGHALVATDYDGTLAPIVDDPAAAVPAPGAVAALAMLAGRAGTVAVITGRAAADVITARAGGRGTPDDELCRAMTEQYPHSTATIAGYTAQVGAGGVRAQIEPAGIAAEALGVAIDPGDRAPALVDHRHDVAVGLRHVVELDVDEVRAGLDERLSEVGAVGRTGGRPGTGI